MDDVPVRVAPVSFKAVRPKKASTLIAEQILKFLGSGELRPGDRLPPERRLAEEFAVNRQAVREALSALQLLGVVDTRAGAGTSILMCPPRTANLLSEIRRLDDQENPFEVMEFRAVIEPEIVRLACVRATRPQLRDILAEINAYEAQVRSNKAPASGDLGIHIAFARASGNSVFVRFIQSIANLADQWMWRLRREQEWERDRALLYLEHHRQIYSAIEAHHASAAARTMRQHLRATQDLLKGHPDDFALKGGGPARTTRKASNNR